MNRLEVIRERLKRYTSDATNTDEKLEEGSISEWVMSSDDDMAWLIERVDDLLGSLEYALRQTGCNGDLCVEDWHEDARKVIGTATAK